MAQTITTDELATYFYSKQDALPGAYLLPQELPQLRGFWANQFDQDCTWYDQSAGDRIGDLTAVGCTVADIAIASAWPAGLVPYITLDGTNDYFYVADNAANSVTGHLTLGGWFWITALGTGVGLFSKYLTTGNVRAYYLRVNSGSNLNMVISTDGSATAGQYAQATSTDTVSAGEWHFLAGRFTKGDNIAVKVDGGEWESTATALTSINDNARRLGLGEYNESSSNRLGGRIAQAWICADAVGDDMLHWLYNAQAPLFGRALA